MAAQSLLIILIVGGVAGWLAGLVMQGTGFGLIGDIIVGVIGSFIGSWLVTQFHLPIHIGPPIVDSIIIAFIGAVVLLFLIGLLPARYRRRRW